MGPKPRRFFPETLFGLISWGMAGSQENSSGQKIKFFHANNSQQGIGLTFFLLRRGVGTFWFILARIYTLWQDETGSGEEIF